jgi:hypothetical protein
MEHDTEHFPGSVWGHEVIPVLDMTFRYRDAYVCALCSRYVRWDGIFEGAWIHDVVVSR